MNDGDADAAATSKRPDTVHQPTDAVAQDKMVALEKQVAALSAQLGRLRMDATRTEAERDTLIERLRYLQARSEGSYACVHGLATTTACSAPTRCSANNPAVN